MNNTVKNKLNDFFGQYPQKSYEKGEIIIHGGEDPSGIFYLESGTVRQYDITYSGNEVVLNVFKGGAFFPMSWAINRTPNEYFFEIATTAKIRKAPTDEALDFIKQNPDVGFDLLRRLYSGFDGLLKRLKHSMKGSARSRTILELIIEARRFGKNTKSGYEIKISEDEFASRAGLSRETVSRELGAIKKKGVVDISYGKITIKNLKKLESELEQSL